MVGVIFVLFRLTSQTEQNQLLFLWCQWHVTQNHQTHGSGWHQVGQLGGMQRERDTSVTGDAILCAHSRNLDKRQKVVLPAQPGDGYSLGRQSWGSDGVVQQTVTPGGTPGCPVAPIRAGWH